MGLIVNGSDNLVTELSVLKLLKLNSVYYYSSNTVPNHKTGIYKAFDHKRYQWYEFKDSPIFWTKVVSIERNNSKTISCTKKNNTLLVKNSR